MLIKQVGNRYYKESRMDFRSFPIKRAEAEKLLAEGKAQLVNKFIWEMSLEEMAQEAEQQQPEEITEQPKQTNIISITDRLQAKREQEQTQQAINKFMSEYLPNLTKEDIQTIINSSKEDFGKNIVQICWRIDLENKLQ